MEIKKILLIFIAILLCSCSSDRMIRDISKTVIEMQNISKDKPIKSFTREMLGEINYPLIEIRTTGILRQTLMLPLSTRDGYVNYTSGSGQIITMQGAAVTKTNGINNGLISLKLNEKSPLVNLTKPDNWLENGTKEYTFLSVLNSSKNINFLCKFSKKEKEKVNIVGITNYFVKFEESCKNKNLSFKNQYWVDDEGFVWKSVQWIGQNLMSEIYIINRL